MKKTRLVKPLPEHGQQQPWLPYFREFIENIRITSKDIKIDIDDPTSGTLKPFGSQLMALEQICAGLDRGIRFFVILKARQLGLTTIMLAIDLFWMIMHPGLQGALVVDEESNAEKNRLLLEYMIENLPRKIRPRIKRNSRKMMVLQDGSVLEYLTAGRKKGKDALGIGKGYNFIHGTEVSRWGDPAGFDNLMSAMSDRHPDRLCVLESTAHGMNHYRDLWQDCQDDPTRLAIFIGWWAKETYRIEKDDQRYAPYMTELDMTEKEKQQEREKIQVVSSRYGYRVEPEQVCWYRWYARNRQSEEGSMEENYPWHEDEAFVLTGSSYFKLDKLQTDLKYVMGDKVTHQVPLIFKGYKYDLGDSFVSSTFQIKQLDPAKTKRDDIELRVWEEPSKMGRYVIGLDPAYGRNDWQNNHCCTVFRCFADKLVQVAEYATHEPETYQVAWVLAHLAGAYRNCVINYEVNGPGNAIQRELKAVRLQLKAGMYAADVEKLGIRNALDLARWYLYHRPDTPGIGFAYGTMTTARTKHVMMTEFRDSHIVNRLVLRSRDMLEEMVKVIQDGDTIGSPGRQRDDRVFAAALAHKAWVDGIRNEMISKGMTFAVEMEKEIKAAVAETITFETSIVRDFFRTKEQAKAEAERVARWGSQRLAGPGS